MNIDKYINRTRRETKKAKLPALSTLSPVLPDASAGISSFNSSFGGGGESFGEDLDDRDMDSILREVEDESRFFMLEKGFSEDSLEDVLDVSVSEYQNIFNITVTADLTISSLRELADTLYPIISKYDSDAYFDISANDSISVDLEMKKSITEQLRHLDSVGFRKYSVDFGLQPLYESTKPKLDGEDRKKLQKFLQTTDDPEEVNTYMKGLLMEDTDDTYDTYDGDVTVSDTEREWIDKIQEAYEELKDLVSGLVGEANRNGNDMLRSSADVALVELDDFADTLRIINDEYNDAQYQNRIKSKTPPIEPYIDAFHENYPTKEEFEDSTDLTWNEYNIADVVHEWVLNDIEDDEDSEEIAMDVGIEVAKKVLG